MTGRVEGKVALVTGAASGIGRAAALRFAREGARVAVADVAIAAGEETAHAIAAAGGQAVFIRADVSRADEAAAMVERTVAAFGRLDCAFNNAGVGTTGGAAPLAEVDEAYWDRVMAVNLKGTWLCMKHEIPAMLRNEPKFRTAQGEYGRGVIVNNSSASAVCAVPGTGTYQASKAGILQLTKAAALDYARQGIRVMAVVPGIINTPLSAASLSRAGDPDAIVASLAPMARVGEPDEVAAPVVFLCSDEASYMTGSYLAVDGGWLIPASGRMGKGG